MSQGFILFFKKKGKSQGNLEPGDIHELDMPCTQILILNRPCVFWLNPLICKHYPVFYLICFGQLSTSL